MTKDARLDLVLLLDLNGVNPNVGPALQNDLVAAQRASLEKLVWFFSGLKLTRGLQIDWRIKICGFGDLTQQAEEWFYNPPFAQSGAVVLAQLKECLNQCRNHGGPGSLLDALFTIANMGETNPENASDPQKWRPRGGAARVVLFFSPNAFRKLMAIPEAAGGRVEDVITAIMVKRVILWGFCPELQGYMDLASAARAEIELIAMSANNPLLSRLEESTSVGGESELSSVRAFVVSGLIEKLNGPDFVWTDIIGKRVGGLCSNLRPNEWNRIRDVLSSDNGSREILDETIEIGREHVSASKVGTSEIGSCE